MNYNKRVTTRVLRALRSTTAPGTPTTSTDIRWRRGVHIQRRARGAVFPFYRTRALNDAMFRVQIAYRRPSIRLCRAVAGAVYLHAATPLDVWEPVGLSWFTLPIGYRMHQEESEEPAELTEPLGTL